MVCGLENGKLMGKTCTNHVERLQTNIPLCCWATVLPKVKILPLQTFMKEGSRPVRICDVALSFGGYGQLWLPLLVQFCTLGVLSP